MIDTIKSPINFDRFEIIKVGKSNFADVSTVAGASQFNAAEATVTIAHGLGFTPVVIAFIQEVGVVTQNFVLPSFSYFGLGTQAIWINLQVAADSTNIYLITDMITYGVSSSFFAHGDGCQFYLMQERVKRTS